MGNDRVSPLLPSSRRLLIYQRRAKHHRLAAVRALALLPTAPAQALEFLPRTPQESVGIVGDKEGGDHIGQTGEVDLLDGDEER